MKGEGMSEQMERRDKGMNLMLNRLCQAPNKGSATVN